MKRSYTLGLLSLGLMLTAARPAEARHRCRPGWDQGYGCYFAAPYVGTGRYCAGYGYGPTWAGPHSYSYYGPAPVSHAIPTTNVPAGMTTPPAAPAAVPATPAAPATPAPVAPAPAPAPAAPAPSN